MVMRDLVERQDPHPSIAKVNNEFCIDCGFQNSHLINNIDLFLADGQTYHHLPSEFFVVFTNMTRLKNHHFQFGNLSINICIMGTVHYTVPKWRKLWREEQNKWQVLEQTKLSITHMNQY